MMIKFTYKEPWIYGEEEKIVYTSTLLNDDMTNLTVEQHQTIINTKIWGNVFLQPSATDYIIEAKNKFGDNIKEIFIKNKTIWNLLYDDDIVKRKLGYNLYKNTLLK